MAFTRLVGAIRHHLAADLSGPTGPVGSVLLHLDPLLTTLTHLMGEEFSELVAFVRDGLLDPRARPENLR